VTLAYHPALTSPIRIVDFVPAVLPRRILTVDIQRAVGAHYGLTRDDLTGRSQAWRIAQPRQLAMYLARHRTQLSFAQIGRAFGGRDHSTVVHAFDAVSKRLASDDGTLAAHDAIVEALA
jgi:chromosomal replication initiator protein